MCSIECLVLFLTFTPQMPVTGTTKNIWKQIFPLDKKCWFKEYGLTRQREGRGENHELLVNNVWTVFIFAFDQIALS